ncbi:polysaccharide biosynthesis protein [Clostridium sediminicola]|uniref:putative polysaccharide biosynthesis protein n=1 Tax=Clostridium sediminicola TaxID=3114879 RepID=UPI0031F220DE
MKRQSLFKGTLILGMAGVFARFIGIFFRIPLTILVGDEGIGYYQMAYPMYMFYIALSSGIPLAMSKIISERIADNDEVGTLRVFKEALLLMFLIGIGTSSFMIIFSKNLINIFKWDIKAYYSLIALGIAPIFISIMGVFRGFFQGLQNMTPTAISQILEQIGRVVIGIGLAILLLPKGVEYAAGGATLGAAAGGILGTMFLFSKYIKIRKEFKVKKVGYDPKVMNTLLKLAIPISLGGAVGTIMNLIDSIIVPQKLLKAGYSLKSATVLYGQLTGKASVLSNVPLTLSVALCASLIPIISAAYSRGDFKKVKYNITNALKLSVLIALPAMCGLYILSKPIMVLIFRGQAGGHDILKYASLAIPFIILTQSTTVILQATTSKIMPIINLLIGCVVKIILASILIPRPEINIFGAVISTMVAYFTSFSLNMFLIRRKLNIKINFYEILIKPAYAAILMSVMVVFTYTKLYNLTMSNSSACVLAVFTGIIVYGLFILIFGVFDYSKAKKRLGKKLCKKTS